MARTPILKISVEKDIEILNALVEADVIDQETADAMMALPLPKEEE